jgi:hypothetical protein
MSRVVSFELVMPDEMEGFGLPDGVNALLQDLLDRRDRGERLSPAEKRESEGLVTRAESISLIRLCAERARPAG